jgi:hypothetical protein
MLINWFFPGASCCKCVRRYEPGKDRITAEWNSDTGCSSISFIPRLIRGFELPWLIAGYGNALTRFGPKAGKSKLSLRFRAK